VPVCPTTPATYNEAMNPVYDEAMKLATEGVNNAGSTDLGYIVKRANDKVESRITYDPTAVERTQGEEEIPRHPLEALGKRMLCSGNANLLRGALRTIGITAETDYFWGGEPSSGRGLYYRSAPQANSTDKGITFQVEAKGSKDGLVGENPHFSFHAMVRVPGLNDRYDPSYGEVRTMGILHFLETSKYPASGFFGSADADSRQIIASSIAALNMNPQAADRNCPHYLNSVSPNPIFTPDFFVTQQYLDFLHRKPDSGGLAFWAGQITACGADQQCIDQRRAAVSAAFFLSVEFQQSGFFLHRLFKATYGRNPSFTEFMSNAHSLIIGGSTAEGLELNKQILLRDWVQSDEFISAYYLNTHAEYVDAIFASAGVTPTAQERADLINGLDNDTETLDSVLRRVVDHPALAAAEFNRSFVLMQYFGYLKRNPDQEGYDFRLGQLNEHNDQNGMVNAFITSYEYRARFGMP
jgi:hypothetical protein